MTNGETVPPLALTPGAPRAVAEGCICPRMDNGHGRGAGGLADDGTPLYWITDGCPLHAPTPEAPDEQP